MRLHLQVLLPAGRQAARAGGLVELVHDDLDDAVQQLLTTRHVAVERHRLDPQVGTQPTHRELAQAVAVDELHGGAQDPHLIQGATRKWHGSGVDDHLTRNHGSLRLVHPLTSRSAARLHRRPV